MASPPGEIDPKGADWYDYEAKYAEGGMELVVPARISDGADERLRELAREAFTLCGCSGLARCDFFVDGDGGAGQRAQHDPRLHRDERLRQALRGGRDRLSRALRPAGEAGRSSATRRRARSSSRCGSLLWSASMYVRLSDGNRRRSPRRSPSRGADRCSRPKQHMWRVVPAYPEELARTHGIALTAPMASRHSRQIDRGYDPKERCQFSEGDI